MTVKHDRSSGDYQREVGRLVHQEVLCCVSSLIYELRDVEKFQDDVLELSLRESYQDAAEEDGYVVISKDDDGNSPYVWAKPRDKDKAARLAVLLGDRAMSAFSADEWAVEYPEKAAELEALGGADFDDEEDDDARKRFIAYEAVGDGEHDDEDDAWRECCDTNRIDPHQHEAYEHWVVSDWLAARLREHGEIVGELGGLTIWGRCTTGQAISMDGVICEIYNETWGRAA